MTKVCFYFQMHQPIRMRPFSFFDIGKDDNYEDTDLNNSILDRVTANCYYPATKLILDLVKEYKEFKVAFSISGVLLEKIKNRHPKLMDLFRDLLSTNNCELLTESFYHSLAFLKDKNEFIFQVKKHFDTIKREFDYSPTTFRNTELIYNNEIAKIIKDLGLKVILAEGSHIYRHGPNYIFKPKNIDLKLLLRNYPLSDDLAFRYSQKLWKDYPLTATKYVNKFKKMKGELINIFIDYETFGEHHDKNTDIFNFLKELPSVFLKNNFEFINPKDTINYDTKREIDLPMYTSWADKSKDLSAWLSNDMQRTALDMAYKLNVPKNLQEKWRLLLSSDHLYYMSTKDLGDGAIHNYFNPYSSPYEAYIIYTNILKDLLLRI